MATAFRRRHVGIVAELDHYERGLVQGLMEQTRELLAPREEPTLPEDSFAQMMAEMGMTEADLRGDDAAPSDRLEADAPVDPALARLLPRAHRGDDAVAADFRRLTEESLRQRKTSNLDRAIETLSNAEGDLVIVDDDTAVAFMVALTDVRLLLGERLGLRSDEDHEAIEDAAAKAPEDHPLRFVVSAYDFLTWMQESLTTALSARPSDVDLSVTVVGCAGSFAGPDSPGSCYLVEADDGERVWRLVLDLGNGALGPLQRHVDPLQLDAVVLSHLHPDHCLDLCGLHVMRRHHPTEVFDEAMRVIAPAGADRRLSLAYEGIESGGMAAEFAFEDLADRASFAVGPMTVTAYRVNHPVEAYGFRVEAGGKVLVYTGDTDSCEVLAELMRDADLVLADAAFVDGRDEKRGVHMTGSRAAEAALSAGGVRRLMLTHIPAWNDPEVCRDQAARVWDRAGAAGQLELAEPDATYPL